MFANRSSFVTYTAWAFIVLTGIGLVIAVLQNLALHYYFQGEFPPQEMVADVQKLGVDYGLSPIFIWMILHLKLIAAVSLLFVVSFFITSIGLLKRLGWARIAFIGLSVVTVAYLCLGLYLQVQTISGLNKMQDSSDMMAGMNQGYRNIEVISYAITAAICAVFAWVIKRLLDDDTAAEFSPI